jgi:hypothetical protein
MDAEKTGPKETNTGKTKDGTVAYPTEHKSKELMV